MRTAYVLIVMTFLALLGAWTLPDWISKMKFGQGFLPWLTFSICTAISFAGFCQTTMSTSGSPAIDAILVLGTFAAFAGSAIGLVRIKKRS
jgi:hypothetical protein